MKQLAGLLDRLSWPVLIGAGALLIALAVMLLISVREVESQVPEITRLVRIVEQPAPEVRTPAAADIGTPVAAGSTKGRPADKAKPPAAAVPEMPAMPPSIPGNLEARIRKRVHDELARVQIQLEEAQQQAVRDREQQRLDAEQAIKDAQQGLIDRRLELESALRDTAREYTDKIRDLKTQVQQAQSPQPRTGVKAPPKPGCVFQGGILRCQLNTDKNKDTDGDSDADSARSRKREMAAKVRDLEQAQREAKREYEEKRREFEHELIDAKRESDRAIEDARRELARQTALLDESKTAKVPRIRIPEIRIPELKIPAPMIPDVKASTLPPVPASPPPGARPAAPAVVPAPTTPPLPAVPLSSDAMALVERDVGSAVADTIGQEVHSAVKGYRLAINSMLVGIMLLLISGAVIGKTVVASNRAARTRADLMRVEAERNLMSRQVVEAQLKMMQAQVEPHFLFNTLANVRFLMEADATAASSMLDHLIEYLHAALPQMRENSTTLGREAELARAYLEILKIRMGNRLQFGIHVADELQGVSLPPMMLLSLVENAIKHGLEPAREGGRIDIEAGISGGRLRVAVMDTGAGFSEAAAAQSGSGVGLANIRERLKTLYGDNAGLTLKENHPRGVIAEIEVPYDKAIPGAAG